MPHSTTGHNMARSIEDQKSLCCVRCISAERRWFISGTPAPDNKLKHAKSLLKPVRTLMSFLRAPHMIEGFDPYIRKSFDSLHSLGYQHLTRIMRLFMIRHTKSNLDPRLADPVKQVRRYSGNPFLLPHYFLISLGPWLLFAVVTRSYTGSTCIH